MASVTKGPYKILQGRKSIQNLSLNSIQSVDKYPLRIITKNNVKIMQDYWPYSPPGVKELKHCKIKET